MAKIQVSRKRETEEREPPSLHGRAIENLQFIRETMERSTAFTAVPGYGGVLMGATAVGAGVVAELQSNQRFWLITWFAEAVLAFSIGLLAMWQKSRTVNSSLTSTPARKFALGFGPPLIAGIILTALLVLKGHFEYLPCVWLTLYGTAVVSGGAYSVKAVPAMGWLFIALGAVSVFIPVGYENWMMASGFGALHIIFGLIIGRRYGG